MLSMIANGKKMNSPDRKPYCMCRVGQWWAIYGCVHNIVKPEPLPEKCQAHIDEARREGRNEAFGLSFLIAVLIGASVVIYYVLHRNV